MMGRVRPRISGRRWIPWGLAAGTGIATGVSPFITVAVAAGSALLLLGLFYPIAVVGITLVTGVLDLGFLTGGFKTLVPELGGLDMNGIRLVVVVGSLTILFAVGGRRAGRLLVAPPFRWYTAFVLYAGLTLLASPSVNDGARLFLKLMYPLIVALVVLLLATGEHARRTLVDAVLASSVLILLIINPIFVANGAVEVEALTGEVRYQGPGIHQNPFALYCLIIVFVSLARVHTRRQWRYVALATVAFVWIVLTRTRIALVGLAAGLFVLEWYFFRRGRQRWLPIAAVVASAGLITLALPAFLDRTFQGAPPTLIELLTTPPTVWIGSINLTGREFLWGLAWEVFTDNPVTGAGLGATSEYLRSFSTPLGLVVHNEYLRVAAETGVVGLGLFGLAVLTMLRAPFRAPKATSDFVDECRSAAAAGFAALAVVSITDNPLDYYAPFTQYLAFILACGVGSATGTMTPTDPSVRAGHAQAPSSEPGRD